MAPMDTLTAYLSIGHAVLLVAQDVRLDRLGLLVGLLLRQQPHQLFLIHFCFLLFILYSCTLLLYCTLLHLLHMPIGYISNLLPYNITHLKITTNTAAISISIAMIHDGGDGYGYGVVGMNVFLRLDKTCVDSDQETYNIEAFC